MIPILVTGSLLLLVLLYALIDAAFKPKQKTSIRVNDDVDIIIHEDERYKHHDCP